MYRWWLLACILMGAMPLSILAQTNSDGQEDWNPGLVVTMDEDTIYGPVNLIFPSDLVQINDENKIKTFGANQVQMVFFRDRNQNETERYLYPFPYHPYSDFKPQRFFEMLFSGMHLSLLSREMVVTETIPQYDNFTFRTYYATRTRIQSEFYLMFPGKKVRILTGKKKDILIQLADKKEEMKRLLSAQNLNPDRKEDLLKIVKEYNRLKSEK